MLGISKKADYGLELMIHLAKKHDQGPVSLKKAAQERKLPFKFLEQVVIPLREVGLIEAKSGRGGGYFLTRDPREIFVAEIVETLEGPVQVGACLGCPKAALCGSKDVWGEVGEKVKETIEGKSLADLIK
jgi:Rrf2 family protein